MSRKTQILGALSGLALTSLVLAAPLCAQEPTLKVKPAPADKPAGTTTLSLSAKLVNLPVVVYDKKGALIQTLTKDDFSLTVDGHPQTIKYFDRDQDLPLTLGLLVDVSRSQSSVLNEERTASSSFIDQMLVTPAAGATPPRKADQAFVIQFGHTAELLGDLTESRPKLQASIQQIDTESSSDPQATNASNDPNDPNSPANTGGGRGGSGGGRRGGGTVLYDAVYLSSNELMKKQAGRKALVILTDGVDVGSKKTIGEAIEAAQRTDTMIFAIYYKGQEQQDTTQNHPQQGRRGGYGYPGGGYPGGGGGYPGGYPGGGGGNNGGNGQPNNGGNQPQHRPFVDGKKVLERMADETGGRIFEVSRKEKVDDIYKMIGEELRGEYRLGYIPDANTAAAGYHKVELSIPKQKQDYIQTREGYYTGN